jgi:hypothetical protein
MKKPLYKTEAFFMRAGRFFDNHGYISLAFQVCPAIIPEENSGFSPAFVPGRNRWTFPF